MWAICCLETARANAYKVCVCLLRAACFVIYSLYSSMTLLSSEIFVVLLLWLRHLLVTLLTAIVFKTMFPMATDESDVNGNLFWVYIWASLLFESSWMTYFTDSEMTS